MTKDEELKSRAVYLKNKFLDFMKSEPDFHWAKKGGYELKTEQLIYQLVEICLVDNNESQWKQTKNILKQLEHISNAINPGFKSEYLDNFSTWIKANYYPKSSKLGCSTVLTVAGFIGALFGMYYYGKSSGQKTQELPEVIPIEQKAEAEPSQPLKISGINYRDNWREFIALKTPAQGINERGQLG